MPFLEIVHELVRELMLFFPAHKALTRADLWLTCLLTEDVVLQGFRGALTANDGRMLQQLRRRDEKGLFESLDALVQGELAEDLRAKWDTATEQFRRTLWAWLDRLVREAGLEDNTTASNTSSNTNSNPNGLENISSNTNTTTQAATGPSAT